MLGSTFAAHAAVAMQAAEGAQLASNLTLALESSRRIGAAIGILMCSLKLSEDEAFGRLRAKSQLANRKLRLVAEDVLLAGELV